MPREVCEEISNNSSCIAPPRNIARRHCESVPRLVEREVCKTRNESCDQSCREETEVECETIPCSGEKECWTEPEEVCEQVQDETCIGIQPGRNLKRRSTLSLSDQNPSFESTRDFLDISPSLVQDYMNIDTTKKNEDTLCELVPVPSCRMVENKFCNPAPSCIKNQGAR